MQTVRVITKTLLRRALAVTTTVVAATVLSVATLGIVAPRSASADAVTYSTNKKTYKVGVLLLDSTTVPGQEARGPENPDPYVFYIADQRTDIKPQGWELDNPMAPATVTSDIATRWAARDPQHQYVVGQKVTKDMAAYWEVSLSSADETELGQYDLLFITNHRMWKLTPSDREKLRKVVDAGGVVWIEDCGGMSIDPTGRFFLEQLQFHGGGVGVSATAGPVIYQPSHPLLNTPFPLSYSEVSNLGDKNYGGYYLYSENDAGTGTVNAAPNPEVLTTVVGNKAATDGVGNALPYIAAGAYGSGAVIATAGDSGCDINDYAGGSNAGSGGNSGAYAGKELQTAHAEDLKFVYNMIAWGSANNTYRNNNRRTGSSFAAVTSPLNKTFDFSAPATPAASIVRSNATPLISQGIMYVSGIVGNTVTLRAYDIQPNRDLDSDGNNDDGVQDLLQGAPYDEIWRWTGPNIPSGGAIYPSSPVLATVTIGGQSGDMILITLPDGTVDAFNARPRDPGTGRLLPTNNPIFTNAPSTTGVYTNATNLVAPAPVFFGNKVYVVEPNQARVRCISANGFGTQWTSTNATTTYASTGAPTLGLTRLVVNTTRDPNRGVNENTIAGNTDESTNDVMLYVPVVDQDTSKVLPFWLGTRNEGTKDLILDGTNSLVRFRPAAANNEQYFISKGGNGFITPSVRVYADVKLTINGAERVFTREENFAAGHSVVPMDPYFKNLYPDYKDTWTATWQDSTQNPDYYSGKVVITHGVNGAPAGPAVPGIDRVLAVGDYDLVYIPNGGDGPDYLNQQPGHRNIGPLTIKNAVTGLDTPVLSPNDLLIYGANQTPTVGRAVNMGSLFGMQEREFSLSASRLRWRFLMHSGDAAVRNVNGASVQDLPAFRNRMAFNTGNPYGSAAFIPVSTANPSGYEALTNVTLVGSPIVTNDGVTYMLAQATSGTNGTVTILMALKTNPQIVLNVGQPILPGSAVTVAQWDQLSQSVISTNGDSNDRTRVDVDYNTGKITIADFGALNNGDNLFSASSSFVVTYQPVTSSTPQPEGTSGQLPVVVPPYATVATPQDASTVLNPVNTVTGGFSPLLWYYVLPGAPTSSPTRIGDTIYFTSGSRVIAVDSDPASNDPSVRVSSGEQIYSVVDSLDGKDVSRNHVRWVGNRSSTRGFGAPVGGEGILAVNSVQDTTVRGGTDVFSESVTLLSDNTRVLEVNSEGGAIWSTDGTVDRQTAGGAGPIYDANGNPINSDSRGRDVSEVRPFRSPQTVRRLSASDYLVADTGNNRVVRFDRGGVLKWSVDRLNDPYNVLGSGEPLTLNSPTDVLVRTLTTFNNSGAVVGFEVHYLIVDSGNSRIIDVVDYYDRNGTPVAPAGANGNTSGIVVWTTHTNNQGKRLAYHNAQLIAGQDGNLFGKPVLVASVSNTSVAAVNNQDVSDSSGGSLVQLDYNPRNTAFILVNRAGTAQTVKYYWADTTVSPTAVPEPRTNGLVTLAINELKFISDTGAVTTKRINKPTYFEKLPLNLNNVTGAESFYLLVDSDGVYACTLPDPAVDARGSVLNVLWQFTQADYNQMNATQRFNAAPVAAAALPRFSPSSVKRLANGHFLITNSAVGACSLFDSGQFLGEVFEVTPTAFLYGTATVAQTVRGGTYADFSAPRLRKLDTGNLYTQRMGRDTNGATVTEQPRSADRL